jgi:hypothetical protein
MRKITRLFTMIPFLVLGAGFTGEAFGQMALDDQRADGLIVSATAVL